MASASTATKLLVGLAAGSVLVGSFAGTALVHKALRPIDETVGTVIRVIDGDTLVAQIGDTDTTIRLLNIDTPETKDPNQPVECLGAEATQFLEARLPSGTTIDLEYDQERTDRYGRTLAGVFKSGSLINEEIAAAGLGTAVVFEPNDKFYETVRAAQRTAENHKVGLFDKAVECTLPGMVTEATQAMSQAGKIKPTTAADALAAAAAVSTARSEAKQVYRLIKKGSLPDGSAALASYSSTFRTGETEKLQQAIKKAKKRHTKLTARATALKAAEEQRAEQEAAQEEYEREYEDESAAEPQQSDNNDQGRSHDDGGSSKANDSDSEYPGYTGPRCYAPGGKSWKPC